MAFLLDGVLEVVLFRRVWGLLYPLLRKGLYLISKTYQLCAMFLIALLALRYHKMGRQIAVDRVLLKGFCNTSQVGIGELVFDDFQFRRVCRNDLLIVYKCRLLSIVLYLLRQFQLYAWINCFLIFLDDKFVINEIVFSLRMQFRRG